MHYAMYQFRRTGIAQIQVVFEDASNSKCKSKEGLTPKEVLPLRFLWFSHVWDESFRNGTKTLGQVTSVAEPNWWLLSQMADANVGDTTYPETNLLSILENFPRKQLQVLPHGVMVIKECLSEEQQLAILNVCMQIATQGGNENLLPRQPYTNESKRAIPILFYNWPAHPRTRTIPPPTELLLFATQLFRLVSFHSRELITTQNVAADERFRCPLEYDPNSLYAIMYPHGGRFGAHLDGARGWVMSISIGESAKFFWSTSWEGEKEYIQIDSGDVVIFNGGQLYHGVEEILPNTAPSFWTLPECPVSVYQMSRFNLQFRDPLRDKLTYDPVFPVEGSRQDHKLAQNLEEFGGYGSTGTTPLNPTEDTSQSES